MSIVAGTEHDGGVPAGAALLAFVDAAMTCDPNQTADVRAGLQAKLSDVAVVDAAAVAAMFQLNTRAADAAGIAIEAATLEGRSQLGDRFGMAQRADGRAP
ncbi:MAG: hypothetical protein AAF513_13835 [Pseudomonadota bacterium]